MTTRLNTEESLSGTTCTASVYHCDPACASCWRLPSDKYLCSQVAFVYAWPDVARGWEYHLYLSNEGLHTWVCPSGSSWLPPSPHRTPRPPRTPLHMHTHTQRQPPEAVQLANVFTKHRERIRKEEAGGLEVNRFDVAEFTCYLGLLLSEQHGSRWSAVEAHMRVGAPPLSCELTKYFYWNSRTLAERNCGLL